MIISNRKNQKHKSQWSHLFLQMEMAGLGKHLILNSQTSKETSLIFNQLRTDPIMWFSPVMLPSILIHLIFIQALQYNTLILMQVNLITWIIRILTLPKEVLAIGWTSWERLSLQSKIMGSQTIIGQFLHIDHRFNTLKMNLRSIIQLCLHQIIMENLQQKRISHCMN